MFLKQIMQPEMSSGIDGADTIHIQSGDLI